MSRFDLGGFVALLIIVIQVVGAITFAVTGIVPIENNWIDRFVFYPFLSICYSYFVWKVFHA